MIKWLAKTVISSVLPWLNGLAQEDIQKVATIITSKVHLPGLSPEAEKADIIKILQDALTVAEALVEMEGTKL